jgi:hypothetical protein
MKFIKAFGLVCTSLVVLAAGCGSHSGNSESEKPNSEATDTEVFATEGVPQMLTAEDLGELPKEEWEEPTLDPPDFPDRPTDLEADDEAPVAAREIEPDTAPDVTYDDTEEPYSALSDSSLKATYDPEAP